MVSPSKQCHPPCVLTLRVWTKSQNPNDSFDTRLKSSRCDCFADNRRPIYPLLFPVELLIIVLQPRTLTTRVPSPLFTSPTHMYRMSTLTQMCTNHAPIGEYFKSSVWKYQNKPDAFFHCPCKEQYTPTLQTRDRIIHACPLFNNARDKLRRVFPRIDNPQNGLGRLVKKKMIEHTLDFLKSGAFSRFHAPYEPP